MPRLYLIVAGEGLFSTHALPDSGTVVIGRDPECDIVIEHNSISRRHAALQIGSQLAIQDLGSSNGTRVRDTTLQPNAPLALGANELVELASVTILVQRRAAPLPQRRIRTHEYFETRLDDECARAEATGRRFSVMHVLGKHAEVLEEIVLGELRAGDVVASYAPLQLELLLDERTDPQSLADRITAKANQRGARFGIGIAVWRTDGRNAAALIANASAHARDENTNVASDTTAIIGTHGTMQDLRYLVERVAAGNLSVVILGEPGVGKEVLAETLHRMSPRRERPFRKLDCAGLPANALQATHGSTLFLDEIGELPLAAQAELVRLLEASECRYVAATNRDLEADVKRGAFRQDLYFRLSRTSLLIPPLRERADELEELADLFIHRAAVGRKPPALSPEALSILERYAWPGNVRELRNMMERAVMLCIDDDVIGPEHLPVERLQAQVSTRARRSTPHPIPFAFPSDSPRGRPTMRFERLATEPPDDQPDEAALEKQQIVDALAKCGGNQTLAAKMLGISRRTLLNRLDEHGVARPRKKTLS